MLVEVANGVDLRKSAKLLPEDINHLEVLLMGFFRTALERTEQQHCVTGPRRHVRTEAPRWLVLLRIICGAYQREDAQ